MSDQWSFPMAVLNLVEAEVAFGKKVIGALSGKKHDDCHGHGHGHAHRSCNQPCDARGCSCRIPTPCWLPEDLGDCMETVEPCGSANLTIIVRNTDGQPRQITVNVTGTGAQFVTVTGAPANVGAFGTATITFAVAVPQNTPAGTYVDVQIHVVGCRDHILNWRVVVDKCKLHGHGCHELLVCDGVDYLHHWYDHFYCGRRCPPQHPSGAVA